VAVHHPSPVSRRRRSRGRDHRTPRHRSPTAQPLLGRQLVAGAHATAEAVADRLVHRARPGRAAGAARAAAPGPTGRGSARAGRALHEIPVVAVQVLEELVVPLRRSLRPGTLEAARERVRSLGGAVRVVPLEALRVDRAASGSGPRYSVLSAWRSRPARRSPRRGRRPPPREGAPSPPGTPPGAAPSLQAVRTQQDAGIGRRGGDGGVGHVVMLARILERVQVRPRPSIGHPGGRS
jgi:hypothetical protein